MKGKEGKIEEKRDDITPEQEYDAAWNEVEGVQDKALPPAEEEKEEELPQESVEEPAETVDTSTEQSALPEEEGKSSIYGSIQSMEKAIKDSRAAITRLAQEKAELLRKLAAYEQGLATEKDVADARKAVADAQDRLTALEEAKKTVYEDYPELKVLIDPILETSRQLSAEIREMKTVLKQKEEMERYNSALEYFNTVVKPKVLQAHPDFDDILFKTIDGKKIANDEYFQWAEKQRPSLRVAAMESSDPEDIIWAVTEFKKYRASGEAVELKSKQIETKKQKLLNAMSMPGGNAFPAGKIGESNPDDYDAAWEEAERLSRQK